MTLNGFQVPALTVRRAETTVELGSGQSFMIAGLLSNNAQNTIDKAPGVGDLPILGNLFRSTEFRKGQTELVIVVTPYLVNPVDDSEIKLPTDGFRAPNAACSSSCSTWKTTVFRAVSARCPRLRANPRRRRRSASMTRRNRRRRRQTTATGARTSQTRKAQLPAASPGFSFK